MLPHSAYHAVSGREGSLSDSQRLRRTSEEGKGRAGRGVFATEVEPGMSPTTINNYNTNPTSSAGGVEAPAADGLDAAAAAASRSDIEAARTMSPDGDQESDETSSLMSKTSSMSGDVYVSSHIDMDRSHRVDIRGMRLLKSLDFWQLFSIMGIMSGIGLMTIK